MKTLGVFFIIMSLSSFAAPNAQYITIDSEVLKAISPRLSFASQILAGNDHAAILGLNFSQIGEISRKIHQNLNRCGGFMSHDSLVEAKRSLMSGNKPNALDGLAHYELSSSDEVRSIVNQVSEQEIRKMVIALSSYQTRSSVTLSGFKSTKFIRETWSKLTSHRSDVTISSFRHSWLQPSLILTIEGSDKPDEIIILGAHADSISSDEGALAPGADDNASGIASITETLRLMMVNNVKPKKTIQFMAYSAEEYGLAGSQPIAKKYKATKKNVIGMLQLDMTLFKGPAENDIYLVSDFTNKGQNEFLGKIIDEYVKVPWGYTQCGYACSDHASWTSAGYPASFSFEASMETHNPHIHSPQDTLENSGGTADHAVKFTKLTTAYVLELSNQAEDR